MSFVIVKERIAFTLLHGHCFLCVTRVNVLCTIPPSAEQDNHNHKWQTWKCRVSDHWTNGGKQQKKRTCTHPSCTPRPLARSGVCWPFLPLSAAGTDGRPARQTTRRWPARSSAWQLPWFYSPQSYQGSPRGGWPGRLSREKRWPPPGGWEGLWNQQPWISCVERKTFTLQTVLLHMPFLCLWLSFHMTGLYRSNSSVWYPWASQQRADDPCEMRWENKTPWSMWWTFAIQCNNKPDNQNAMWGSHVFPVSPI